MLTIICIDDDSRGVDGGASCDTGYGGYYHNSQCSHRLVEIDKKLPNVVNICLHMQLRLLRFNRIHILQRRWLNYEAVLVVCNLRDVLRVTFGGMFTVCGWGYFTVAVVWLITTVPLLLFYSCCCWIVVFSSVSIFLYHFTYIVLITTGEHRRRQVSPPCFGVDFVCLAKCSPVGALICGAPSPQHTATSCFSI